MRIGYVGNFSRPWCTEVHVSASLEELGHTIFRFQENTVEWRSLPAMVKKRGVELLLWTRTWEVDRASAENALNHLRADGVPSVSYHLDRFHGLAREPLIESEPFFKTDLLVTPDDGPWARYGVRHKWLPPGVYGKETGKVAPNPTRWPWEVVFVGSHPYPHEEWQPVRGQLIEAFRAEFGDRFAVLPAEARRTSRVRPLRGRELQELYATVPVVLGDSCLVGDPYRYWSDRIPETIGRGAALIHPAVRGLSGWYSPGSDFLTYQVGQPEEAVELAVKLLESPAELREMADHGRVTALNQDLYTHRMTTVLDWVANGHHLDPLHLAPVELVEGDRLRARVESPRAEFELVDGLGDLIAVEEVWQRDYPITPEMVDGQIVVDIGANVGAFSVLAAKLGARKVLAFEAHPANYAVLCRNLKLNGVEHQVYPVCAAVVGVGGGDVPLSGDSTACHVARLGEGETPQLWVQSVGADDAVPADAFVVKMDCEGGEYDIIGALTHWPVHLFLEWHGPAMPHLTHLPPVQWSTMVTTLAEHGRLSTIGHPARGGLLTWTRY